MTGTSIECDAVATRQSVTEKLTNSKKNLEEQLSRVNKTIQLLEDNPNVSTVLDSLAELNIRL